MTEFEPQPGSHRHPDAEPLWARESFTDYAEWDEPAAGADRGAEGDDEGDSADDYAGDSAASPLADEVVRLIGGVQDWARRTFTEAAASTHTGPECQWCPLCQFLAVLKGDRPDVTERVAEAGTAMLTALRAVVESAGGAGAASSGRHAHPGPGGEPDVPRVQRIDLGDSGDPR